MRAQIAVLALLTMLFPASAAGSLVPGPTQVLDVWREKCEATELADKCEVAAVPCSRRFTLEYNAGPFIVEPPSATYLGFGYYDLVSTDDKTYWTYSGYYAQLNDECLDLEHVINPDPQPDPQPAPQQNATSEPQSAENETTGP